MRNSLLTASRNAFVLASAGLAGLLLVMLMFEDGVNAAASVAGVPIGAASAASMQIVVGLDLIIPLGYGAGFILLAVALSGEGQSRLLSLSMVLLTIVGMTLDLLENGTLLTNAQAVTGGSMVTVAKYGTLGAMVFMMPLLLSLGAAHRRLATPLFQLLVPVILATTIMQLSGEFGPWLLVPGLIFIFLFAAWLANCECDLAD